MSRSTPAFPFDYSHESVTLLVMGSAPCLMADFNVAKALRPNHLVMAINDAAAWLAADFLFSFHAEKLPYWANAQQQYGNDGLTTHTARKPFARIECANHTWDAVFIGASSAIGGAHVGLMMGFREVILCGAPMNGGDGYYQPCGNGSPSDPRFGLDAPVTLVEGYQARLRDFVKIGHGLVFSMSGLTRKILGAPPEVPVYAY